MLCSGFGHIVLAVGQTPAIACVIAPLVEGAGGCMTDWEGRPLRGEMAPRRVIAAANMDLAKSMQGVLYEMLNDQSVFQE